MKFSIFLKTIIFLSFYNISIAQTLPKIEKKTDSLTRYSYNQLEDKFYLYENIDIEKAKLYAKSYFLRSKKSTDSVQQGHGYRIMSYISKKANAIAYADSIVMITKNSTHKYFPTVGYLLKAYYYYQSGDNQKALDNYLIAYPYAVKKNNFEDKLHIQNAIANLKDRWGAYDESLLIYKKSISEIEKQENYFKKYNAAYLSALFNVSLSYIRNKKLDSAFININKGINLSLKHKNQYEYYLFVYSSGIANYELDNYDRAFDSLSKSISHIDNGNRAISHYYMGDIHYKKKNIKNALIELKKMDSIFQATNNEFPQLISGYGLLMEHYKTKQKPKKQLEYIQKIIHVDSMIDKNYIDLNNKITKKYDVPLLMKEKENVIDKLEGKLLINKKTHYFYVTLLILFVILLLLISFLLLRRNANNKKRFEALMLKKDNLQQVVKKPSIPLNISDEIIKNILEKTELFERKKGYLKQDITINKLAKKFNTNEKYLSKVINLYKEKKFIHYINDLRIDDIVDQLKNNNKLRLYTIKAIAFEAGFNTSQSFSNAFQKRTGIKPSYFIEQLK